MKRLLLVLLVGATGPTLADGAFSERAERAKTVEDSPEGQTYQELLWPQVGDHTQAVMQQCFPKDAKLDTDSFTLVADVLPNGILSNVDIQPSTVMSRCFAKGFAEQTFPKPSKSFGESGIPLVINMRIKP